MSAPSNPPQGLDIAGSVDLAKVSEGGMLLGDVGGEAALLVRYRDDCFVTGTVCTH